MRYPTQLLSILLCILSHITHAQLEVSGPITVPTIWAAEESPFVVSITSDVTIMEQGSLTVEAGVHLNFTGPYSIFVRSSVLLKGLSENPIRVSNGAKAFSLMEQALGASLTARHTIFENHSGGAIMREWPSVVALPPIVVEDCTFVDNQYAIRAFDVRVSNSEIRGGRIGVSLHRAVVENTTLQDCEEICLFAGSESEVNNCQVENCGTIGVQIHGEASNTIVKNAAEGISGVIVAWEDLVEPAQVKKCVVEQVSNVGLQYIDETYNTIVKDSPTAIGALLQDEAVVSNSVIVGNRIGVSMESLAGDTASATITDSYICGNLEAQFDAFDYFGTSSASRVYFGNTQQASAQGTLGELLRAVPFLPTASGRLNYNISDFVVDNTDSELLEQVNVEEVCGISGDMTPEQAATESPTASPATPSPTVVASTSSPTVSSTTPSPTVSLSTPAPVGVVVPQQKPAPSAAKCGSIGLSSGRGGAAGQAKGCTSRIRKRKIRGL